MAVQLFKAGTGHVNRGIECQTGIFNEYSYLHLLDDGWHYSPEGCYAEGKDDKEEIEPEEKAEQEADATQEGILTRDDEIRAEAKAAGINHHWNKTIPNLENELRELENAEHRPEG
jgi:hypothetical protein